jgi:hypothetical protein
MRRLLVLVLVSPLVAGCTPYLPMRADFGTSGLAKAGDIPPEYAAFNAYDPGVSAVMAEQICATNFQPRETITNEAQPGQLVTARGTCAIHQPIVGN